MPHARITYTLTDVTTFGATVSYICADLGYKLHGPSSILCTGDGRWTAAPLCLSKMMKINQYLDLKENTPSSVEGCVDLNGYIYIVSGT